MHKDRATELLKLVPSDLEDDARNIENVASKIKSEVKSLPGLGDEYPVFSTDYLSEI